MVAQQPPAMRLVAVAMQFLAMLQLSVLGAEHLLLLE